MKELRSRIRKTKKTIFQNCKLSYHIDKKYFGEIRGKHRGEKCFIVGNGPSLRTRDLERMKGAVTIASNRIYLAFDQTDWRPDYYITISNIQAEKFAVEIENNFPVVYTKFQLQKFFQGTKVRGFNTLGPAETQRPDRRNILFSDDLSRGMYGGRTVTFSALQLAAHLGCNPIYIVGCDHNYGDQPKDPVAGSIIEAKDCQDHFHPEYRSPGEGINPAMIDSMDRAFLNARFWAEREGVKIANATRGGFLEVFDRVGLDEVLEE